MRTDAPRTPQEALSKAMALISSMRDNLPGKAGGILTCMDEITNAWENQDLGQFPFNLLHGEVNALADSVRGEYDDLNQVVDRRSFVYEQVIGLQHRLRMSIEFVVSSKIFESVERRFQRIDEMLPTRNYAMRDLLLELRGAQIGLPIKKRLETAIHRFDRQEYEAALQECGQAGEALFSLYKAYLARFGCGGVPRNMGLAMGRIRRWLEDGEGRDRQGHSLAPRSRLEWFLLSLFESLHYLRNAASHPLEAEKGLPTWQSWRREPFPEKPEYARLGLCLSFQIALELQALLDHEVGST